MATTVIFNDREIIEPGVYAAVKGGGNSQPQDFSFGNVCIIDTGSGAGYGGGSGIDGEMASDLGAVYGFDNLPEFRSFVRGGVLWDLADYLFNPGIGIRGVSKLWIVRAATTTSASATFTLTNGVLAFKTKNEGACANGVLSTKLRTGYGVILKAGAVDSAKFMFEFFQGTYKGTDAGGEDIGGIAQADCEPALVCRSAEVSTIQELLNWVATSRSFNALFTVTQTVGVGAITSGDLAANASLKLFAGATTTYNSTNVDLVLDAIKELDNTFFLADNWEDDSQNTYNVKILSHIVNEAEFDKFMMIGGGRDDSKFKGSTYASVETCQFYNSANVMVKHSGIKVRNRNNTGFKILPSIYNAALELGKICGLQPQQSATFKGTRANMFCHLLKDRERKTALQNGLMHDRFVPGIGFVLNQAVNTLQSPKNVSLIQSNGQSYDVGIMRIAAQLNKELVLNMRPLFVGGNLNTASPADVKAFIEGYLTKKTATKTDDNLIISFKKITVKQVQDYYVVEYSFVPNGPINKIFVTGFMLDSNLTA